MISRFFSRSEKQLAASKKAVTEGKFRSAIGHVVEQLEQRQLLTVVLGSHYTGLNYAASGGFIPPDSQGAAGTTGYVETVNQAVRLFPNKSTSAGAITDSFNHFWFTTGSRTPIAGADLSDPIVVWDNQINRFIIGDQEVNFGGSSPDAAAGSIAVSTDHTSAFYLAVSKSASPASLGAADWSFYSINTTEKGVVGGSFPGTFDADYPGNFGFNKDAFVFTLNMFDTANPPMNDHVQVNSVDLTALVGGTLTAYQNDVAGFSLRPTAMHDSVTGDPMWLVEDVGGGGSTINVLKMTNVLSNSATFTTTTLAVTPYGEIGNTPPKQPDGTVVTPQIDSRIMNAAEANNVLVTTHAISVSGTEDDARWYAIDVSSGTPILQQEGNVSAGNNTYVYYPGIDINPSGTIGMSYMESGTGAGQFMSVYVTGRTTSDVASTMETPVLVQAGVQNYHDFGPSIGANSRAGDMSGINVDANGSFWIANEYADNESTSGADWAIAIANFSVSAAVPTNADLSVTKVVSVGTAVPGQQLTYTIVVSNSGPSPATGAQVTDTLPANLTGISESAVPSGGASIINSSGTGDNINDLDSFPVGSSITYTIVASINSTWGSTVINTVSVSPPSGITDPNLANNTATAITNVVPVAIEPDPVGPGTSLFVGAGFAGDVINIAEALSGAVFTVMYSTPGSPLPVTMSYQTVKIERIFVYAIYGGASITLKTNPNLPVDVFASGGANTILENGTANDILVTAGLNNKITTGYGLDVVIGGVAGGSNITSRAGDLIVAGGTSYDMNLTALTAISAEWSRNISVAARAGDIEFGGGLNGGYELNSGTITRNTTGSMITLQGLVPDLIFAHTTPPASMADQIFGPQNASIVVQT